MIPEMMRTQIGRRNLTNEDVVAYIDLLIAEEGMTPNQAYLKVSEITGKSLSSLKRMRQAELAQKDLDQKQAKRDNALPSFAKSGNEKHIVSDDISSTMDEKTLSNPLNSLIVLHPSNGDDSLSSSTSFQELESSNQIVSEPISAPNVSNLDDIEQKDILQLRNDNYSEEEQLSERIEELKEITHTYSTTTNKWGEEVVEYTNDFTLTKEQRLQLALIENLEQVQELSSMLPSFEEHKEVKALISTFIRNYKKMLKET